MGAVTPPRPLAEADDRSRFDCGRDALNVWFHRHAWNNHAAGTSRTNVICSSETCEIAGYVTLCAAQIEREFLKSQHRRNALDPMPVTLLGQLAIQKDFQGEGYAASLLQFALRISRRASLDIGSFGVITHPLNDGVRAFYGHFGFEDVPFDPRRSMIVRMSELEKAGL